MYDFQKLMAKSLVRMVALDGFFILAYVLALKWAGIRASTPEVALISAIVLCHWLWQFFLGVVFASVWEEYQENQKQDQDSQRPQDDPWALQRELMRLSGQERPAFPVFNKGGILYLALIMEEFAETLAASAKVMKGQPCHTSDESADTVIRVVLSHHGVELKQGSERLRELLDGYAFERPMSSDEAFDILDGTTDIAVTNCGFALACGLPGSSAYQEVLQSNLSKVNPITGVIDKLPDGKWIKGRDYFKPDLIKVLHAARKPA